jgi:hypothetical protein
MDDLKPKLKRTVSTISYEPDVLDFLSKTHHRTGYSKSYLVNFIIRTYMEKMQYEESDA